MRAISRELVRKLGTSEKEVSRHCRYLFLLRFIIGSFSFLLAGLPAGHSDKWEIPSVDFPLPYRSRQGVHGPRRAHSAAVTSLQETRYQHEKITGNFSRVHQHETRTCARAPAMLFTRKFLYTRVRACVLYVGVLHAVTFETLLERGSQIRICSAARYEDAASAKEVIRFLLLLLR